MTNKNALFVCGAILVAVPIHGFAATVTFDNGQLTQNWTDPLNWDLNVLPGDNDIALIENSEAVEVSGPGAESGYIRVSDGATLTVSNGTLTYGRFNNRWMLVGGSPGTVIQTGGTVQGVGSNSDLYIDDNGVYDISGGTLSVTDDLRLFGGGRLAISGSPIINVGDDFRLNGSTTIDISLSGTVAPTINVLDDLRLGGTSTVNIDATSWMGASTIALFNVADQVNGNFDFLTVNGVSVDPNEITFSSNQVLIPVTEPSTSLLALVGIGVVTIFWSRRGRKIASTQRKRFSSLFANDRRLDKPLSLFSPKKTRGAFSRIAHLTLRPRGSRADSLHPSRISEKRGRRHSPNRKVRQIER